MNNEQLQIITLMELYIISQYKTVWSWSWKPATFCHCVFLTHHTNDFWFALVLFSSTGPIQDIKTCHVTSVKLTW